MKIERDKEGGLLYVDFTPGRADVAKSRRLCENVVIDLNESGLVVGIEFLNESQFFTETDIKRLKELDDNRRSRIRRHSVGKPKRKRTVGSPRR